MRTRYGTHLRKLSGILVFLLISAVLLWFFSSLRNLNTGRGDEGKQQLETALRRAAVSCYASEGIYPPTLDYLIEHYGIQVNESQYIVSYDIFADNIMPEITVLTKEGT